jgi:hypothetical protein
MNNEQLAALLDELAAKARAQSPMSASVDRDFHNVIVPDGSPFVRRESTGGETVRIEIVWP